MQLPHCSRVVLLEDERSTLRSCSAFTLRVQRRAFQHPELILTETTNRARLYWSTDVFVNGHTIHRSAATSMSSSFSHTKTTRDTHLQESGPMWLTSQRVEEFYLP